MRCKVPAMAATFDVCAVPISAVTPERAAGLLAQTAVAGGAFEVHLCNAFTLSLVGRDQRLREALLAAQLNLPDGTPVAWFGRRLGVERPVRGSGLLRDVARAGVPLHLRHYLYGGAPGVAGLVKQRLAAEHPGLQVVGTESPPYRDLDDDGLAALADRVRTSGANLLWIGLGTPRQDYLVRRLAPLVDCTVVPVGAAFDFLAGRVAEAPRLLHGSGLEWAYRLWREPGRLWRRYLVGNPRFLLAALRSRTSG